jgi:hypothetical protein
MRAVSLMTRCSLVLLFGICSAVDVSYLAYLAQQPDFALASDDMVLLSVSYRQRIVDQIEYPAMISAPLPMEHTSVQRWIVPSQMTSIQPSADPLYIFMSLLR